MENFSRKVTELGPQERTWLERNLGRPLSEDQRIVVHVLPEALAEGSSGKLLPEYFDVFAGMSDEELAEVERVILTRCDLSRQGPVD